MSLEKSPQELYDEIIPNEMDEENSKQRKEPTYLFLKSAFSYKLEHEFQMKMKPDALENAFKIYLATCILKSSKPKNEDVTQSEIRQITKMRNASTITDMKQKLAGKLFIPEVENYDIMEADGKLIDLNSVIKEYFEHSLKYSKIYEDVSKKLSDLRPTETSDPKPETKIYLSTIIKKLCDDLTIRRDRPVDILIYDNNLKIINFFLSYMNREINNKEIFGRITVISNNEQTNFDAIYNKMNSNEFQRAINRFKDFKLYEINKDQALSRFSLTCIVFYDEKIPENIRFMVSTSISDGVYVEKYKVNDLILHSVVIRKKKETVEEFLKNFDFIIEKSVQKIIR